MIRNQAGIHGATERGTGPSDHLSLGPLRQMVRGLSVSGHAAIASILLILGIAVALPVFLPNLEDIAVFDESDYMNNGLLLRQGKLPAYAANPMVAFFWAIVSLPFLQSPYWMLHSATLGRLVLFSFMWLGAYALSRELLGKERSLLVIGFLLITQYPAALLDEGVLNLVEN
jgi:hypothetical protein